MCVAASKCSHSNRQHTIDSIASFCLLLNHRAGWINQVVTDAVRAQLTQMNDAVKVLVSARANIVPLVQVNVGIYSLRFAADTGRKGARCQF
jgi:hypothetical protein